MKDIITVTTTAERAAALRAYLGPHYLGHTALEERIRELLNDLDMAIEAPKDRKP